MTPEPDKATVQLNYETPPKEPAAPPPYRDFQSAVFGLIFVIVGGEISYLSFSRLLRWVEYFDPINQPIQVATVFAAGVTLFIFGCYVLWMFGRAMRGLPTYHFARAVGRALHWIGSAW